MAATFLCISEDFKGVSFMRTLHAEGCRVFLLTDRKNEHEPWPHEAIERIFYNPESVDKPFDRQALVDGTAYLMREFGVDRVVALDDFDVEDAALLREEFRIPGMGQTTARYFRDKLAMRMRAREHDIPVPAFSALFRKAQLEAFCGSTPGPYVIKPRSQASAAGIHKVADTEEALRTFAELGDKSYRYLIERFAPGQVYHVDALIDDAAIRFVRASKYADAPLAIVQGGGLFQTRTLDPSTDEHRELVRLTDSVMRTFGMRYSASHTEFIRGSEGELLFLETSSRVGGAYISSMILHASGVDLWAEWAKLEVARLRGTAYESPQDTRRFGGISLRAVSQKHPDLSMYASQYVVEEINKAYHAGVILASDDLQSLSEAQDRVAERLATEQ